MMDTINLTNEEIISELAKRVSRGEITVTKISTEISKIVKSEKNTFVSEYDKVMQKNIKKFAYIGNYDLRGTLGVFEIIHRENFKTVDEFLSKVAEKNGVTILSLKYSLFDNNMRQYSALRQCLVRYFRDVQNIVDISDYWKKLSKEEKLNCYRLLEKHIYNL